MTTEIWRVALTTESDRREMEELYRRYYVGAPEETFRRDFLAKDRVIVLREDGAVRGFSTLKLLQVDGVEVLFSGDTVVDAACRNQTGLAGAFGHVMRDLAAHGHDDVQWFLICKGARTYRFLPTFFKRFVPGGRTDAALEERLRRIASALFPEVYDPATGVLHFGRGKDRLRSDRLRADAESVRFRTLNPNWAQGDELACLAPLRLDNLNRLGERVIASVKPEWHL